MVIELIYLLILATSLPVGWFLAWLCDDELKNDRRYFFIFIWGLLLLSVFFLIFYFKEAFIFSLIYMVLIVVILLRYKYRSFKKH